MDGARRRLARTMAAMAQDPRDPQDPAAAARVAGLRYSTDRRPCITRRRAGRGFSCRHPDGTLVRDAPTLARIRALAIPPAWRDVWICPSPSGHLQAVGRDARGRKQYRYHARWHRRRRADKFGRMLAFADALPRIRARCDADLARPGLPRDKVLAAVVRLLELTLIRVGNDEYARLNRSFGLTTLRDRHARIDGGAIRFRYRGKSGQIHDVGLRDRRLAVVVRRCQELPGQELFQYRDDAGEVRGVASEDVNDYLRATPRRSRAAATSARPSWRRTSTARSDRRWSRRPRISRPLQGWRRRTRKRPWSISGTSAWATRSATRARWRVERGRVVGGPLRNALVSPHGR